MESDGLNLLTVVKFANSGLMQTREGRPWVTVANETVGILEALVCEPDTKVVQYTYSSRNVTFLLVVLDGLEFEMTFLAANQRRNLNEPHLLSDKNYTKSVTVIVKSLRDSGDLYRVANKKLLHELFVANRHNSSIDNFIFAR